MESIGLDLTTMQRVPLADSHVARLREAGHEARYPAGEIVTEAGEQMDRFIYVLEGEIEPFLRIRRRRRPSAGAGRRPSRPTD